MFLQYKKYIYAILSAAFVASIAFGSYQLGTYKPRTVIVKGVDNIQDGEIKNVDFSIYWQVWDLINKNYLKADEISAQDLVYGSAAGLVKALGDPYSDFLKPENAKKFKEDINGSFGGIGAEIGIRGDFIVIIAPLKESPAEKAGLKAGDKVLEIDGEAIGNLGLEEVVKKIRGPKGTKVTLTVLSNGDEKSKKIEITRQTINVPTVKWEIKEGNIAYVNLFTFNESAPSSFAKNVNEALGAGAEGMILDLRNNPGGFLEVAVSIAGVFVDSGEEIVAEEFSSGDRNAFVAGGSPVLKEFPMVILVNKGSASASEILAGALRHYKKVKIIGENTFGKGTVQELKSLPDGSTLKITVAHWVLPDGTIIEGNGIKPDVEVKLTEEDLENKKDPQLEKAIEILLKQISQ